MSPVVPRSPLERYLPAALAHVAIGDNWEFSGSVVFSDVSGFTRLSEQLARLGKAGAEELTHILNRSFTDLLTIALTEGGDLLSYGGDALLLAYRGEHHADRAVRAAVGMREVLRTAGAIVTDSGRVRLRISQGVHSGTFAVAVAGARQRELMLIGRGATTVTDIEGAAGPGDVLVSAATAELLGGGVGPQHDSGAFPVRRSPDQVPVPPSEDVDVLDDLEPFLPTAVTRRIMGAGLDAEHRFVGVAFVQVRGVDAAIGAHGLAAVTTWLGEIVDATERAAAENDTCLIASDIAPDGVKLIVTAGAPDATEDVEGALLSTIRNVLDQEFALPVRAGAHAGHVFAGEVGSPARRVYTVIGDTVNLAARLMGKAETGELVASADLLARAGGRFAHQPLEPFFVKGKRLAQHASVVGERAEAVATAWSAVDFVGRDRELRILADAVEQAWSGHGSVVDLVGGPGVGKSRLLHHFLESIEHARIIRVTSEPYQSNRPFYASRLLLRALLGIDQALGRIEAGDELLARLGELDPRLLRWAPLLGPVVDVEVASTREVDALGPEFRLQRLREVVGTTLALALPERTVLVFEDANHVDDSSREVLEYSLNFVNRGPWLVVLTRRDVDQGLRSDLAFPTTRIDLGPFEGDDLLDLAQRACEHRPIPDDELASIVARAGGNPLFLLELVQARIESGPEAELPSTLEGILAARIDQLAGDDRRALRHLAVLGDRVPPELAEAVLVDLVPGVADRQTWARLREFVVLDQGDLRFRHGLVRDVAYEGLPFARRRLIHRRFAESVESQHGPLDGLRLGLLALHFDLANDSDRAYRYCSIAGRRAKADGANAEAASLLDRAIVNARRLGDVEAHELAEVAEEFGDAAELAARYQQADTGYRLARSLLRSDDSALARLARKEGIVRERTGKYNAALDWYRKGRKNAEALEEPEASTLRADLLLAAAGIKMHQGRLRACIRWAERALAAAVTVGYRRAEAHAYYMLDLAHTDLGDPAADDYRDKALPIFEELGDDVGVARTLGNLSVDARYEGRWDDSLELAARCSEIQERVGDVTGLAMSNYNAAEVLQDQGRLEEAEEMLERARRTWRAADFTLGVGAASGALGRLALRRRDDSRAVELIDEAVAMFREMGADSWVAELSAHRVEADLFAGRWQQVLSTTEATTSDESAGQDAALQSKLARFRAVAERAIDDSISAHDFDRAVAAGEQADSPYETALAQIERADAMPDESRTVEVDEAMNRLRSLGVIDLSVLLPEVPYERRSLSHW